MTNPAYIADLDQAQAACTEMVNIMIAEAQAEITNPTGDPATLSGRLTLEFMRAGPFVSAGVAGICIARLAAMQYEYGIRNHKDGSMHRWGYTLEQAHDFMNNDWDDINPHALYEIVRRPVGEWETIKEDK